MCLPSPARGGVAKRICNRQIEQTAGLSNTMLISGRKANQTALASQRARLTFPVLRTRDIAMGPSLQERVRASLLGDAAHRTADLLDRNMGPGR